MRKFFVFLLSLTISLTPTFIWAGAAEKWEIVENVYDETTQKVNVTARKITKQAANSSSYKVSVPVNAATLGSTLKSMLKGGVASVALYGLVEGVGWIIDEGSKTILKPNQPETPNYPSIYRLTYGQTKDFYTLADLTLEAFKRGGWAGDVSNGVPNGFGCYVIGGNASPSGGINCYGPGGEMGMLGIKMPNPDYNQNPEITYSPVSDSELGNEVMGNGQSNVVPSLITDAYNPNNPISDAPAPQQTNDALDSANPNPETEPTGDSSPKPNVDTDGDGEPDTHDPAQPEVGTEFTLPNFCEWAPAVCDFFSVQKQDNKDIKENQNKQLEQDKTFFEKVQDWFDWSQEPPDLDQDEIDIQEPDEFDTSIFSTDRFSVSRQCPAPEAHTIALSGVSVDFSFDLSPLCQVLEFARPALVACSYLYAAYIVIGAARNG